MTSLNQIMSEEQARILQNEEYNLLNTYDDIPEEILIESLLLSTQNDNNDNQNQKNEENKKKLEETDRLMALQLQQQEDTSNFTYEQDNNNAHFEPMGYTGDKYRKNQFVKVTPMKRPQFRFVYDDEPKNTQNNKSNKSNNNKNKKNKSQNNNHSNQNQQKEENIKIEKPIESNEPIKDNNNTVDKNQNENDKLEDYVVIVNDQNKRKRKRKRRKKKQNNNNKNFNNHSNNNNIQFEERKTKHDSEEWSKKHKERLKDYEVMGELGDDIFVSTSAFNNIRNTLDQKGYAKHQPLQFNNKKR